MKIQRKKSFFTRTRLLIIALVLLLAAGGTAFWWFFLRTPNGGNDEAAINSIDYSPPTEQEKKDSADAKERAIDEGEGQNQPPTTPTSNSLIVTINRAGQLAAGQDVAVRTQIDGATSGTCEVAFTRSGVTVTKTFTITSEATTTTCNGDIPASEFNTAGEWELSVTAKASGVASKPAAQKVTVQK